MPAQSRRAIQSMKHLLSACGMQAVNIKVMKVYRSREDPRYFASLQELFGQAGDYDASSQSRLPFSKFAGLNVYDDCRRLAPGQHVRIDFTAASSQSEWTARIQSAEVLSPPDAVHIGPVLWTPMVTAAHDPDGAMPRGIEAQVQGAFDNLERLLDRAGIGRGQILRIAGYMRDLKDKDLLNNAMVERFPVWSEKPVHKYVPSALPEGVELALQALAVDGGERRILEIDGIKHNDPISLGALVGNVFVSSRVQARLEPTAREQAARLVESHARRLVEEVGGSLQDVTQLLWGIGDPAFEADVRDECAQHWPPGDLRVDVVQAPFAHSPLPRLEFIALLGRHGG
jgi:enamine deaminase RidA (YjgF/YER057c/UK114 family)